MKVICINNKAEAHKDCKGAFMPKEGKTYTVTETVNWYGLDWYLLKEDKSGNGWNPAYFIPISENKFDTVLSLLLRIPKMPKRQKLTTFDRDGY